ncbi:hypothetical protein ACN27G_05340 [Plantactinospora sp. WMMB334]|uniref:hypothetical protein n=1 Tax=Plantactinospora sp. WMMB334 TaxID=3404119 RepID=UPI003B95FDEE
MRPIGRHAFRAAVRAATVDARIVREARAAGAAASPPPPPSPPPSTRHDGWNGVTWAYPEVRTGSAGNLTPAQRHRARHAERV